MSDLPARIAFRRNVQHVPRRIPVTTKGASTRFLALRDASISSYGADRWEMLRQVGHDLRLHAIAHLDYYLEMLEEQVTLAGGQVHWARNAAQARDIVLTVARQHHVKRIVKAKSMATEEIGLNAALQNAGIAVFETDLGEYIVQLAGETPSHITGPALHMTKEEIAALFQAKLGVDAPPDPARLSDIASARLRHEFLTADLGITGGNFLVAETGTLVLVTNEGNGRMCTTLPPVHLAVVGIDKTIPDWQSLATMLALLPRNATGQQMTAYTSLITGLRQTCPGDGPAEFHLVLLDNGRTEILRDKLLSETLLCIRCGACLNVCPVYNNVGGHAYGWTYSGPIGAILTSQLLGPEVAGDLPFASSLCGACNDVCPVRIPITEILLRLRRRVVEEDPDPSRPALMLRAGARIAAQVLQAPLLYHASAQAARVVQVPFRRDGWLRRLPPPLNRWTMARPLPAFRAGLWRWWRSRTRSRSESSLRGICLVAPAVVLALTAVWAWMHRRGR